MEEEPTNQPQTTRAQELTLSVFDNPDGLELLGHYMASAGITAWIQSPNEEARIRKDELQRFVHSILLNLAMTPDQIRGATIARHDKRHTRATTYNE